MIRLISYVHETVNRLSSYSFWFKDLIDALLALRRTCASWREITKTATLESFTPHQPTSPAQPFDQDDREAIIFPFVALVDHLTNPAAFCRIWTHSLKVPSASTLIYFNQMANKNRPNPQALDDPSQLCAEDQLFDPSGPPPMAPTALEETVWQNHHLPEGRALTYWLFPYKSCRIVQIVLILLWNNLWTRIYIAGAIRFCCSKYQKRSYSILMEIAIWSNWYVLHLWQQCTMVPLSTRSCFSVI